MSFYENAMDCTKVKDMGEEMTVVAAENVSLYLMEMLDGSSPLKDGSATRDFSRHWPPVHLGFLTDDVAITYAISTRFLPSLLAR